MYSVPGSNKRGMVAVNDIKYEELIAFIPRSMIATYIDLKNQCNKCQNLDPLGWMTRSDYRIMALAVLENRDNPFSEWYHWMQTFQTDFNDHLFNAEWSDLKWFTGSQFKNVLDQRKNGLTADYRKLMTDYPGFNDKFTFQEYKDAFLAVQTHSYDVKRHDIYEMTLMAPFVDLFNQVDGKDNNVMIEYEDNSDYTKTGFYVRALKNIPAGQPLHAHYGAKNNSQNLIQYGIYDKDYTSSESIRIPGQLYNSDPYLQFKQWIFMKGDPATGHALFL